MSKMRLVALGTVLVLTAGIAGACKSVPGNVTQEIISAGACVAAAAGLALSIGESLPSPLTAGAVIALLVAAPSSAQGQAVLAACKTALAGLGQDAAAEKIVASKAAPERAAEARARAAMAAKCPPGK